PPISHDRGTGRDAHGRLLPTKMVRPNGKWLPWQLGNRNEAYARKRIRRTMWVPRSFIEGTNRTTVGEAKSVSRDCRRFCSRKSLRLQQIATAFNERHATGSISIS